MDSIWYKPKSNNTTQHNNETKHIQLQRNHYSTQHQYNCSCWASITTLENYPVRHQWGRRGSFPHKIPKNMMHFGFFQGAFSGGNSLPQYPEQSACWGKVTNQFQPDLFEGEYRSMRAVILRRHSLWRTIICPTDMLEISMFWLLKLGRCCFMKLCHRMRCLRRSLHHTQRTKLKLVIAATSNH